MDNSKRVIDTNQLLSTGKAAQLLGSSRQHVVDLCESGQLPCVKIGTHRRIKRDAVEAFLSLPPYRSGLRREELVSLWLHRAVAGQVVQDPDGTLHRARENLVRLSQRHPSARTWLDAWRRTVEAGPENVLQVLTSPMESAVELRQNSPFAGVLEEGERRRVLQAFRNYWAHQGTQ